VLPSLSLSGASLQGSRNRDGESLAMLIDRALEDIHIKIKSELW